MPISGNSWKEIRQKRVIKFIPEWQHCPINRYYTINRILLLCVGLWPYQKSSFRHIIMILTTIMMVSAVVFQTQNLIERVHYDWNELNNMQEIEIIKEYSAIGRFITLLTTLFIYVSIFCFIFVQFLSNFLLDILSNKNESHLRQLPILIECFIDQQKYFFPILLQMSIIIVCGLTTVAATETLIMSHAHHACGLFEIASYRIEQALHASTVEGIASPIERSSIIYQGIINGFDIYRRAIEFVVVINMISEQVSFISQFVEMMTINYKWAYSLLLPLGVLSLSVNLYRFSWLITSKEYYETIMSFIFILGHFWYMLFCNYLGQQVIDHSSDIFYRTYNVQWYVAPLKVQKLLLLVMQRSIRHCTIVIGGLFIPSLEGFATLASTSISYFAVIFSVF